MPHDWILIAGGRVCTECSTAQAKGEFEDDGTCPRDKPSTSGKPEKKPGYRST